MKNGKNGRIIPSSFLMSSKEDMVGYGAVRKCKENRLEKMNEKVCDDESDADVLITSAKRIWGMNQNQIEIELEKDQSFLESLPFKTKLIQVDTNLNRSCGAHIAIGKKERGDNIWIDPIEIAEKLLKSIKIAAEVFLSKERKKMSPVGMKSTNNGSDDKMLSFEVRNCVIGVPAHFGRNQRKSMEQAAKNAGFDGHVATITESTAAAMAYGLFVSTSIGANVEIPGVTEKNDSNPKATKSKRGKTVLVFDMGGGTTDVTIATMKNKTAIAGNEQEAFQVVTAVGNSHLGGDDLDDILVRHVVTKYLPKPSQKNYLELTHHYNNLRYLCRKAKEQLSGDGTGDVLPVAVATIQYKEVRAKITQDEFENLMKPLVHKTQKVVEKALDTYCTSICESAENANINEVVLVGGSTKLPSIRAMLRSKFPPPIPPDLCYSINADAAVAQGAAIQSAILSGLVPKHDVRNALMLDALPHTIGILIGNASDSKEELYVPVLTKDTPLPAMGYKTFTLADIQQKGITVVAVEDVGDDEPLQNIGEFNFLLHKMPGKDIDKLVDGKRTVDVGITLEVSGKMIVSVFDWNDPEHLLKKKRYQEIKSKESQGIMYSLSDDKEKSQHLLSKNIGNDLSSVPLEQICLIIGCIIMFLLYITARIVFHIPTDNVDVI